MAFDPPPPSRPLSRLLLFLLVAVPLLLAPPSPAAAQEGAEATEDDGGTSNTVFFEALDVNVVNVDVYATDKKGERVTGLSRDDFEIFEDGQRMEITNFYAVDADPDTGDRPPVPLPVLEEGESLPPGLEEYEEELIPEAQRQHFILYFDNLNLRPFNRNRVILETRRFLYENVERGDRVMVIGSDRSLRVRQPFTADLEAVFKAMEEMRDESGFGAQRDTERDRVIRLIDQSPDLFNAEPAVDFYAKSRHSDVERSLKVLKELIGSLGGLPGRKAVIHVSDGIPMMPGMELFHLLDLRFGGPNGAMRMRANRYDLRRQFREVVARANANRVTFYTIDAAGLQGRNSISAESASPGGSLVEVDFLNDSNRLEPLEIMAEDTGGQAVLGTNNLDGGFERIAGDFESYYSLGYRPAHSGDGRYHTIEVRVKKPGVNLRHRKGYRDKTTEARISEGTLASLIFDATRNPLEVEISLGRPSPSDGNRYLVPVELRIPIRSLALLPTGSGHRGSLRVSLAVMDRDGDLSPPEQKTVPLEIPAAELETARGKHFTYTAELLMRPGTHSVAAGVHDEISGETSFVRQSLAVNPG